MLFTYDKPIIDTGAKYRVESAYGIDADGTEQVYHYSVSGVGFSFKVNKQYGGKTGSVIAGTVRDGQNGSIGVRIEISNDTLPKPAEAIKILEAKLEEMDYSEYVPPTPEEREAELAAVKAEIAEARKAREDKKNNVNAD